MPGGFGEWLRPSPGRDLVESSLCVLITVERWLP